MNLGIRLLTQGDDFGSNKTITEAIIEANRTGMLKNTSVMVNGLYSEEAARQYAGEGCLCFGLHLTMNAEWDQVRWGPILPPEKVSSLVKDDGTFLQSPALLKEQGFRPDELMAEASAQLARARELGYDIRYADTHMRFEWIHDELPDRLSEWCKSEGLIYYRPYDQSLPSVEKRLDDPADELIDRLKAAKPGTYLLIGHPAYVNDEMLKLGHAGYDGKAVAANCDRERRYFTDPKVLAYCRENGVRPVRYDEL